MSSSGFVGMAAALVVASCGGQSPARTNTPWSSASSTYTSTASASSGSRRQLTVALYPYVPHREAIFAYAKAAFECKHPDVEVLQVDQYDHYYKSKAADSIVKTHANVTGVVNRNRLNVELRNVGQSVHRLLSSFKCFDGPARFHAFMAAALDSRQEKEANLPAPTTLESQ